MRRREFISLLGGAAVAWPLAARAQQGERMRRIGVLMSLTEDDPDAKVRLATFQRGLEMLGWSKGRNVRIDYRFAPAGAQAQVLAKELVALQPDVILSQATPSTTALHERHARSRSSSWVSPTPSVQASSPAWRGRAPISQACCCSRPAPPASGSRCSRRWRRASRGLLSYSIPRRLPIMNSICVQPRPRPRRSGWNSCLVRLRTLRPRSSEPSSLSRACQTAA